MLLLFYHDTEESKLFCTYSNMCKTPLPSFYNYNTTQYDINTTLIVFIYIFNQIKHNILLISIRSLYNKNNSVKSTQEVLKDNVQEINTYRLCILWNSDMSKWMVWEQIDSSDQRLTIMKCNQNE